MSQADNPENDAIKNQFSKAMDAYPQAQITYQLKDGMDGQKKWFGTGCDGILTIDKLMDSGVEEGEEGEGEKVAVKICFDEATVKAGNFAVMHSDDCVNVYIPTCKPAAGQGSADAGTEEEGEQARVLGKIFLINLDRIRGCACKRSIGG